MPLTQGPFHLLIKPVGAACNLACSYCYYREKSALYPGGHLPMQADVLEAVTAAYLQSHPGPEVAFGWQGGEPLLRGLEFYQQALELQARYAPPGMRVTNSLQTNGTLLDDTWAEFFARHHFLIGVSCDGPPALHDHFRRDLRGQPSHGHMVQGLAALRRHGVQYNALVTVNRANAEQPVEVYRHLTRLGFDYLQFIPVVERVSLESEHVTPQSVRPEQFGRFLCRIFDYWARHDVGRIYVQLFESTLHVLLGGMPDLCVFAETCGHALAVEHNGDLYACDHYVYPEFRRGVVTRAGLQGLVEGAAQQAFGAAKADLAAECRRCPALSFCNGDCPKHRFRGTRGGKPISYLCEGYRQFFEHAHPILQAMAREIRNGRPAAGIMRTSPAPSAR